MKTIRLLGMTDSEYAAVTRERCPKCGSTSVALTRFGNVSDDHRSIDILCDSCGYEWEIEDADVVKISNEKVLAMRELNMLTDNKIRHLKKDAMVALAYDLGVTNACGKTKTYLADLLISIKNGEIKC